MGIEPATCLLRGKLWISQPASVYLNLPQILFPASFDFLKLKILTLLDERPTRTVRQLRTLLSCIPEFKKKVGRVSDRTIYRFLQEKGLTKKKRYAMACESTRISYNRFEAIHSPALVQGDARDGIWILLSNEKKRKTYLFVWLDDYSRKILYAQYYWDEKFPRMEDSFKKMTLRWGLAEKVYLDNGYVYSSKYFAWLLSQLDIKKVHHKPYAAYYKGNEKSGIMKSSLRATSK